MLQHCFGLVSRPGLQQRLRCFISYHHRRTNIPSNMWTICHEGDAEITGHASLDLAVYQLLLLAVSCEPRDPGPAEQLVSLPTFYR